jgi:hypothetical protein
MNRDGVEHTHQNQETNQPGATQETETATAAAAASPSASLDSDERPGSATKPVTKIGAPSSQGSRRRRGGGCSCGNGKGLGTVSWN